ncbi:hypothetical protein PENSPDRAFT_152421 [Peniophora sp. CONT]|nr:hypothetical protein PENSPDRAFT_152421 [Peniophora sp. CONT]
MHRTAQTTSTPAQITGPKTHMKMTSARTQAVQAADVAQPATPALQTGMDTRMETAVAANGAASAAQPALPGLSSRIPTSVRANALGRLIRLVRTRMGCPWTMNRMGMVRVGAGAGVGERGWMQRRERRLRIRRLLLSRLRGGRRASSGSMLLNLFRELQRRPGEKGKRRAVGR